MADQQSLLLGEAVRSIDERFRLSLPSEMAELIASDDGQAVLAKEQPGCLSLWNRSQWGEWLAQGVELIQGKIRSGRLAGRVAEVQRLGRLLSTRHRDVSIAGRGRLLIPEGFREFLGVDPGGEVLVIGAAVCVELWHPERWHQHIGENMPEFRQIRKS